MFFAAIILICVFTLYYIQANLKLKKKLFIVQNELEIRNLILNNLPCPIWFRGNQSEITYTNLKYQNLISERTDSDGKEINQHQKALALKMLENKETLIQERHLVVGGQRRLYEMHEIFSDNHIGTVGMAYDISSKDIVRSELNRHISAQSDLLEATSSAIAIYGPDIKIKFFNRAFVKLWDLDESWLSKQPTYTQVIEILRKDRKLPEQLDYQQFKRERLNFFHELTSAYNDFLYLPDGRSLRVIIVPHALGGLLFSYEDITDRLALESSYKTLSAVQKKTIDNLNEGIIVVNENGKIALSNSKFNYIWGIELSVNLMHITEVLNTISSMLKDEYNSSEFNTIFISNINNRKVHNLRIEKKDESVIDILFAPLPDGATLVSFHDITDSIMLERNLRERNQALKEADKLKMQFLSNVSYELRSPLTSIMGFSESLVKNHSVGLDVTQKEYMSAINESSSTLMRLINDILDIASVEAGYTSLDIVKFDIHNLISSLLPLLQESIKNKNLKFKFLCDFDIGLIFGDPLRIKQVIFQLANNAIENSKNRGQIILEVKKISENIHISIENHGYKIKNEDKSKIFDPFSNILLEGNRDQKQVHGTSLAVAKTFIEMHHGKISLIESNDSKTIFECILPINHPELEAKYNIKVSEQNLVNEA